MNKARIERLERRTRKADAVRVIVCDEVTGVCRDVVTGEVVPEPGRTIVVKRLGNVSMDEL